MTLEKSVQEIEAEKVAKHDIGVEIFAERLRRSGYEVDTHIKYEIEVHRHPNIKSEIDVRAKKIVNGELELILGEFKTTDNNKAKKKAVKQLVNHNILYFSFRTYDVYAHYDPEGKEGVAYHWIKK